MPKKLAREDPGPLERLFGSATARVLDFLIVFRHWDYSLTDIAENAEVSLRTVLRAVPYLERLGIIKHTRNVGRAKMYQFDMENPIAKSLAELTKKIATKDVELLMQQQKRKPVKVIQR
jgi:DNA-binding transcriptional regulator GbsR (MarR family)